MKPCAPIPKLTDRKKVVDWKGKGKRKRNFSFHRPDQAWVGDITYIPAAEGWLYLAIVKDLCTRKIVGYAFSSRIDARKWRTAGGNRQKG